MMAIKPWILGPLSRAAISLVIAVVASGCTCASKCSRNVLSKTSAQIAARFEPVNGFPNTAIPWQVYATRTHGPPIILFHDVTGPSPACLALAERLSREKEAYRVYIPVFYGCWGRRDFGSFIASLVIARKGWNFYTPAKDQPCLPAIERLCHALRVESGRQVLVIGNCATGGVAIALLRSPDVAAVVASQPALPYAFFFRSQKVKESLDVAPDTLREAVARAKTLPRPALLGFHYFRDRVVPDDRIKAIAKSFKRSFTGVELCEVKERKKIARNLGLTGIDTNDSTKHSVLINGDPDSEAHYWDVYRRLVDFLDQHSRDGMPVRR